MAFFSVYCGFLYNDFTAIPLYLFGDSCYVYTGTENDTIGTV
jgi:hypothetical protein